MGAIAAWLDERCETRSTGGYRRVARLARLWSYIRPARLDPGRTVVIADFHPSRQALVDQLGGLPARMALPIIPHDSLPEVAYSLLRTDVVPMDWGSELSGEIPTGIDTVASFLPWEHVPGVTLKHWWKLGIRRVWFLREDVRVGMSPLLAAASRKAGRLLRMAWPLRRRDPAEGGSQAQASSPTFVRPAPRRDGRLRITHYIDSLTSGGAERQLCNSAIAQKKAGHDVRVLLAMPPVGRHGHYLPLLEKAGVPAHAAGACWHEDFPARWDAARIPWQTLPHVHQDLREAVFDLAGELVTSPPDILHCWLDRPNITGFVASRLTGIAPVLLSFRCVSPEFCPRLLTPWMKPLYQQAAATPGVTLLANAEAGARDYERWLGLTNGSVQVIRNAFVPPPQPDGDAVADLRRELALQTSTPVVAGVFRLDPEKRPLFFLKLVAVLRSLIPDLRVLMAGCGVLEDQVTAEVQRLGLNDTVHLLGQRSDVPVILAASQVMLLTSEVEGTPNAVLEGQYFGCVPVVTDVGGTREALAPSESGVLCGKDDAAGLIAGVVGLMRDPRRRQAMARAGKDFVTRHYDPEVIQQQTMRAYAFALESAGLRRAA
jgi:glycosyltransferase involved in cell wall biosynthesis